MGLPMGVLQAGDTDVGIDLRGRKAGMTQEVLHQAQVGSIVQQMGRVGMPDLVWSQVARQIGQCEVLLQKQLNRPGAQPLLSRIDNARRNGLVIYSRRRGNVGRTS